MPLPTYRVVWDRFRGKYVASSDLRPNITVVNHDAILALDEIQKLMRLLR